MHSCCDVIMCHVTKYCNVIGVVIDWSTNCSSPVTHTHTYIFALHCSSMFGHVLLKTFLFWWRWSQHHRNVAPKILSDFEQCMSKYGAITNHDSQVVYDFGTSLSLSVSTTTLPTSYQSVMVVSSQEWTVGSWTCASGRDARSQSLLTSAMASGVWVRSSLPTPRSSSTLDSSRLREWVPESTKWLIKVGVLVKVLDMRIESSRVPVWKSQGSCPFTTEVQFSALPTNLSRTCRFSLYPLEGEFK